MFLRAEAVNGYRLSLHSRSTCEGGSRVFDVSETL